MDTLNAIVIGLLTTLIASLLTLLWRTSSHRLTYRKARALWRPFASGDLKIITGDLTRVYSELKEFEAGGLVGTGDVQAAAELIAFFGKVGFLGFNRSMDVVRGNRPLGELYGLNLVCIGGPDANEATEEMLARIGHTLDARGPLIRDDKEDKVYKPREGPPDSQGKPMISLDYGVLIKTRNPEAASRQVLIIAGCYGYGTWAGAKLACSERFLRDPLVSQGRPIECLYSTHVISGVPQEPQVLVLRDLPDGQKLSGRRASKRRHL
jgi:hypothetical protein